MIDKPWTPHLAVLARNTGASVVSIGFHGRNSVALQAAGRLHPLLRTAMLPREFLTQRGKVIDLRIGKTLAPADLPVGKRPKAGTFLGKVRPDDDPPPQG